jgi:PEGA domain
MKRILLGVLLLFFALPGFASTHKEHYNVPCNELWRALKDTLKNSEKYGIIGIDNAEMTASYNIGGNLTGKRVNSAILNSMDSGNSCEMQIQTAYSGIGNNDAGDLKKRVDQSLDKLKGEPLENSGAAASSAPVAAAPASLAIDSNPSDADIEIDGAFVGNTPSTLSVAPGSHRITVKKRGFKDWTKTLNVTGGTVHLKAELEQ